MTSRGYTKYTVPSDRADLRSWYLNGILIENIDKCIIETLTDWRMPRHLIKRSKYPRTSKNIKIYRGKSQKTNKVFYKTIKVNYVDNYLKFITITVTKRPVILVDYDSSRVPF